MKYIEETSLYNLHDLNYDSLKDKISKSKKDIEINFFKLDSFLKLIQDESMIINKSNFPITLVITVSAGKVPYITINLEQKENPIIIFPHLMSNYQELSFNILLLDFNSLKFSPDMMILKFMENQKSFGKDVIFCNPNSHYIIAMLKKIDEFLNFDDNIYKLVYNTGLYNDEKKISYESFNVLFSTYRIKIESKAKYKGGYFESFLSIDGDIGAGNSVNDVKIKIDIYKQKIILSYKEFMEVSMIDLINALVSVVKLKNINVNDMESLKFELALQDMINI